MGNGSRLGGPQVDAFTLAPISRGAWHCVRDVSLNDVNLGVDARGLGQG